MKKSLTMITTAALAASIVVVPTASAQYVEGQPIEDTEGLEYKTLIVEDEVKPISEDAPVEVPNFIQIEGVIGEITKEPSGLSFVSVKTEGEPFYFYFDDKTVILNNAGEEVTLKEGMEFTAYVDSSKPMIMIYPPRYSPEVVIVQTEEAGTVQYDQFDKNFLNKNKDLVIHVNEKTEITNLSGTKLSKEDIVGEDVVIFYDIVLKSYPGQTSPSNIIVLKYDEEESNPPVDKPELTNVEKAYKIAEEDFYVVNDVKMVPLRLIAEQLGYTVSSNGKGAIVSKGALSYTITRGTKSYGYNKAIQYFEEKPALLEKGKTYVPYEFLEILVNK
ncbi:hypothetical protein MTP04_15720 [Lysinibacillus sp. PLM2]|nr:hypothetical protein MTP04_15720 [Lysinibacillus sp. PLM2]